MTRRPAGLRRTWRQGSLAHVFQLLAGGHLLGE
jgi:hypothetical protein